MWTSTGAVQSLRSKYRSKMDYSTGFGVIHTLGRKGEKNGNQQNQQKYVTDREHEFIAILPLDIFLEFFADPIQLADVLTKRAKKLVAAWMERNGGKEKAGKRRPNQMCYTLCNCEWRTSKNKPEKSSYTLQLSTFNYTLNHQQDENPKIKLTDIKVKRRSKE